MKVYLHTNLWWNEEGTGVIEKALMLAEKLGVYGIDVESSKHLNPLKIEDLGNLKDLVSAYNVKINLGAHHAGGSLCDTQESERRKRIEYITKLMEIGRELNSKFVSSSLDPIRNFDYKKYGEEPPQEAFKFASQSLKEVCKIADECGMIFAVENDVLRYKNVPKNQASCICFRPEHFKKLEELTGMEVPVVFDWCNAYLSGQKQEEVFSSLKQRIVHAHLKDAIKLPEPERYEIRMLGEGESDSKKAIGIYKKHNIPFSLEFSLNPNPPEETARKMVEFVKKT